jgi:hypothetical protein
MAIIPKLAACAIQFEAEEFGHISWYMKLITATTK